MEQLIELVTNTFEDLEVREVAFYVIARNGLIQSAQRGMDLGKTEATGISPEQLMMSMAYDTAMTTNKFYISNFAVIKSAIAMDEVVLESRSFHMHQSGDASEAAELSKRIVRELLPNRFSALTTLVFLADGLEAAKTFDAILRTAVSLTPSELAMFEKAGV